MDALNQNFPNDTIFAPASGQGRAGISVVRISGPDTNTILRQILRGSLPNVRKASLRKIRHPESGHVLDEALVLRFSAPASFTGEDMAELHLHGSPAVLEAVATAMLSLGLRLARAGEFTRRGFENGKMDLTEAEGLADLIDAQTERQRVQALRQMDGGLKDEYELWREAILDALAQIEGEIDFPDEGDVPDGLSHRALPGLQTLSDQLKTALQQSRRGEAIRHGVDIAIIGAPNAGKSSLINGLTNKDTAIVSHIAGTTRDVLDAYIDIDGLPVRLSDTAGLRLTKNVIEAEGVRRARARASQADLRIALIDMTKRSQHVRVLLDLLQPGDIILLNKTDLNPADKAAEAVLAMITDRRDVSRETFEIARIAATDIDGVTAARRLLTKVLQDRFSMTEDAGLTRARHRDCVVKANEAVSRAITALSIAPELAGDDLRRALHAIKELAGETDIEAVLDRIFSRFCIGK
ncbi:tRNA uridine-5-carboxymethylaminomethyl(34) synthesis GTPase MnmE [Robiginitomaculum antarcticum]|uniref:tRNA uridine-5-carboxymethylaminomethyl(34) synthesis GTPase MnmE n=1 Tax=Robiginitomaculum antarcticum TaxID=437507 RepID=UPI000381C9E6|nr:tRNA uridine-5-carboxymethylaminomethyl(34) synthesis GTPase MnmE [Robiginitomaculum antarcticum]